MACECLAKCLENLQKEYKDPNGSFNTAGLINFHTGKASTRWPFLVFSYRRKKKDETPYKNQDHINITPNYCPICGIKYE